MIVEKNIKKCAMCGYEYDYKLFNPYKVAGTADLDLRPTGVNAKLGEEIEECPECHYCNYDISKLLITGYQNNENRVEKWKNDVADIVLTEINPYVRKYRIMARQYAELGDSYKRYKMLLSASWVSDNEKRAEELQILALSVYNKYVLKERTDEFIQMADTARQLKQFNIAQSLINGCMDITNRTDENYAFIQEVLKYETELIRKQDSDRHNLEEVKARMDLK